MDDDLFEVWASRLTIIGGQAFLPGERIPAEYRAELRQKRTLAGMPARDRRAYKAEWQRRHRAKRSAS